MSKATVARKQSRHEEREDDHHAERENRGAHHAERMAKNGAHRSEHATKIIGHTSAEESDSGDHGQAEKKRERVPPRALPWGFVRNAEHMEEAGVKRDAEPGAHDAVLWFDRIGHRFLIEVDKFVIDTITPLQFVQLIRELRHIETRVLFKYERKFDGTIGAARRVWARR